MKKLLFRSVAALAACALSLNAAYAQEAFKHLSIGAEAGTTGIGIQLAMPVVTNHLVLSIGYNMPDYHYSFDTTLSMDEVNDQIRNANSIIARESAIEGVQVPAIAELRDADIAADAHINLSSLKAMLEYYPFKGSSFHIKAGVVVGLGGDALLGATADVDKAFWAELQSARSQVNSLATQYPSWNIPHIDNPTLAFDGKYYRLRERNGSAYFGADLKTAKVRPYAGIGFGRAIPRSRVSMQVDLGAWFHGKPELVVDADEVTGGSFLSASTIDIDPGFDTGLISKICVYPQVTFRINVKLF